MLETKIILEDKEIPKKWYNVLPELTDLKTPLMPPLHPVEHTPMDPSLLEPLFAKKLIEQETNMKDEYIDIPEEVLKVYSLWRPTPMFRAAKLERALGTPARIYYKYEGVSPPGSHKPNTSVPQAYYNKVEGVTRITTETGAGQWGSALAFACQYFDLQCEVYMVRCSYDLKPYRRIMMNTWGAQCIASPSTNTKIGNKILKDNPEHSGTLGIAISEAVELAMQNDNTKYCLGSVLNHVMLHQTVIGLEAKKQFAKVDETPDILIGCCGGGSNFAGFVLPYVKDKKNGSKIRIIAVEPTACPTLTKGEYRYDWGDTGHYAPMMMMYTLGSEFTPPPVHAGGLRYHGESPIISQLRKEELIEARAYHQLEVFEAAMLFARTEGIICAPETSHAVKATIDEALKAKEEGKEKVIAFNLSGHGHFDLASYLAFQNNELTDYTVSKADIEKTLADLPDIQL